MATLLVDRVEAVSSAGVAFVVKVLDGTVRVEDHAVEVESPQGERRPIELRVFAIHRYPDLDVDELEPSFSGCITFYGRCPNAVDQGWKLYT